MAESNTQLVWYGSGGQKAPTLCVAFPLEAQGEALWSCVPQLLEVASSSAHGRLLHLPSWQIGNSKEPSPFLSLSLASLLPPSDKDLVTHLGDRGSRPHPRSLHQGGKVPFAKQGQCPRLPGLTVDTFGGHASVFPS